MERQLAPPPSGTLFTYLPYPPCLLYLQVNYEFLLAKCLVGLLTHHGSVPEAAPAAADGAAAVAADRAAAGAAAGVPEGGDGSNSSSSTDLQQQLETVPNRL